MATENGGGDTSLLQQDFCPWANRYVYWLKSPLGQLAVAAGSALAVGIWAAPQGYAAFGALSGVILLGLVWPWVAMRGITGELQFERTKATEGSDVLVTLAVWNRLPFPVWGLLLQGGFHLGPAGGETRDPTIALALGCVPGWSKANYEWTFRPDCRGEYPLIPPRLATEFPFGLWRCGRELQSSATLLVRPATLRYRRRATTRGEYAALEAAGRRSAGAGGEVLGTRPYREGDSPRQIHWTQSARHDRWIVKERQAPQSSLTLIALDLAPEIHTGCGANETREWAIRATATLARALLDSDQAVVLAAGGESVRVERGGWDAAADFLARIDLSRVAELTPGIVSRIRASRAILVTTNLRERTDAELAYDEHIVLNASHWERDASSESQHLTNEGLSRIESPATAVRDLGLIWERHCRAQLA